MRDPWIRLGAGAVVAALVVAGVVLAASGSGGDDGVERERPLRTTRAELKLERAERPETRSEEVVVSLPNERLNTTRTTGGSTSVLLRCADHSGQVTIRQRHGWPLVEEYGFHPHIHQPATAKVLDSLRSCRITGRGVDFVGRVDGRLPPLQPRGGAEG